MTSTGSRILSSGERRKRCEAACSMCQSWQVCAQVTGMDGFIPKNHSLPSQRALSGGKSILRRQLRPVSVSSQKQGSCEHLVKAGRPNLLPVPHALAVLLRSLPRVKGNPYVFPGKNGLGHLHDMKRAWDRTRVKAGIRDVRFHDLRRTVGSWLVGSGESLQLIGKVLNHRDVSTMAIYARLDLSPVRQALECHATKMLKAAAPQRTPAVRLTARKRSRSASDPRSHTLEPASIDMRLLHLRR